MGVEKSAEAIVVAARWRRAESAVRSRTWIAQTTGKKSKAGDRGNLATKGGEVECRDMGARCQSGCDEKRTREHAERTALNCGNREVPATGMLRGVGGEAFLPYPITISVSATRGARGAFWCCEIVKQYGGFGIIWISDRGLRCQRCSITLRRSLKRGFMRF